MIATKPKCVECPSFEGCGSPLCPMDEDSMEYGIWYPGEEFCKRKEFRAIDWIKRQRAITKVKVSGDRYFTVAMLQGVRQVRKGIEGIDPNWPLDSAKKMEKNWIRERSRLPLLPLKTARVIAEKKNDLVLVSKNTPQGGIARSHE